MNEEPKYIIQVTDNTNKLTEEKGVNLGGLRLVNVSRYPDGRWRGYFERGEWKFGPLVLQADDVKEES